jgi:hypothetical protein
VFKGDPDSLEKSRVHVIVAGIHRRKPRRHAMRADLDYDGYLDVNRSFFVVTRASARAKAENGGDSRAD